MSFSKAFLVRTGRWFLAATLTASLQGCGLVEAIRDRPLISEMGILQSRKEWQRRMEEESPASLNYNATPSER
jgi:hypothetical protein